MSHHSDDNLLVATSDSFWEPGNYKRTTKRIEDGYKLCNDLMTLIQERADIEKTYSKNLKGWSKKWNELIEKGKEPVLMRASREKPQIVPATNQAVAKSEREGCRDSIAGFPLKIIGLLSQNGVYMVNCITTA